MGTGYGVAWESGRGDLALIMLCQEPLTVQRPTGEMGCAAPRSSWAPVLLSGTWRGRVPAGKVTVRAARHVSATSLPKSLSRLCSVLGLSCGEQLWGQ